LCNKRKIFLLNFTATPVAELMTHIISDTTESTKPKHDAASAAFMATRTLRNLRISVYTLCNTEARKVLA